MFLIYFDVVWIVIDLAWSGGIKSRFGYVTVEWTSIEQLFDTFSVACMAAYLLNITPRCALSMEVLQQKYLNVIYSEITQKLLRNLLRNYTQYQT